MLALKQTTRTLTAGMTLRRLRCRIKAEGGFAPLSPYMRRSRSYPLPRCDRTGSPGYRES